MAADGATDDSFGDSVALDGDTAVIGASLDDDNGSRIRALPTCLPARERRVDGAGQTAACGRSDRRQLRR